MNLPPGYTLSDDPARFDLPKIVVAVQASYWGEGRPADGIRRAFAASTVVGICAGEEQAAFARAVSDGEFFGWIGDVFVWPEHRGRGLGVAVVGALLDHPRLANVDGWTLATRDAHSLYERFGFERSVDGRVMRMRRTAP